MANSEVEKLRGLEFSLSMGCALDCDYCPQRLLLSKYYEKNNKREKVLSLDGFKHALEFVEDGGLISICGMSEPFSNPNCTDMLLYAYEKGYRICFNTTLMGATKADIMRIKHIKFENFILHIPDKDRHSKFCVNEEYLELLDTVHNTQKIDYYSCHGEVHDSVRDHIDLQKYAGIKIRDRAGNLQLEGLEHYSAKGKVICLAGSEKSAGIWSPVMLPDGTLVLCCNDYGMKHVLGNLLQNDWESIKKGTEFETFIQGLNDENIDILCRTCSSAKKVSSLPSYKLKQLLKCGGTKENEIALTQKLKKAETVCVYGVGKFFKDHFFYELWNESINPDCFSDRNEEIWGTTIRGIDCVSPDSLVGRENVLIVVFVINSGDIVKSLKEKGFENIITYQDLCDVLIKG